MEPGKERKNVAAWEEEGGARIKGSGGARGKVGASLGFCADLESEEQARGWTRANGSIRSTNVAKYIPGANRL